MLAGEPASPGPRPCRTKEKRISALCVKRPALAQAERMTGLVHCLVSVAEEARFEPLRGCPQHAFPTMLPGVHRRPPPSANCVNTIRATPVNGGGLE